MKNTVRVERAIKDITQQELASAVGVSRQTINSIEAGGYVPSAVLALKIAKYFGKPAESIFVKTFLTSHGIALYDTCTQIIRTKNTASDKDLQVVEQTDIKAMLQRLPQCKTIVTAGQLATTLCAQQLGVKEPQVGTFVSVKLKGRMIQLYRMPSSSRAYPMAIEKKAEFYQTVFDSLR